MTFTAAHDPTTSLADMRAALADAWTNLQKGRPWKRLRKDGLLGVVRTWEVTGGHGGWHLHVHALAFHSGGVDAAVAAGRQLSRTWISLLGSRGFSASELAQDVRPVDEAEPLGAYGVKSMRNWTAAAELARGWMKEGRRPGRLSLPEILGLAANGDKWAAARYAEAVVALKGQRVLVVGPSLKAALDVTFEDVADGDALDLDAQGGEVLGQMSGLSWTRACVLGLSVWVLEQVDELCVCDAVEWCDVLRLLEEQIWADRDVPDG